MSVVPKLSAGGGQGQVKEVNAVKNFAAMMQYIFCGQFQAQNSNMLPVLSYEVILVTLWRSDLGQVKGQISAKSDIFRFTRP